MNLIPGINSTASALHAEKTRMNVVAQNIANANTTRSEDGEAYKRKIVAFESLINDKSSTQKGTLFSEVNVASISEDKTPTKMIYNPHHPDANEQGMVEMPNVEVSKEMVDMITSSRSYEANLQVIKASRTMAQKTIDIGK